MIPMICAVCPRCRRDVAVTAWGTFREHKPTPSTPWDNKTRCLCAGSGRRLEAPIVEVQYQDG